MKENILKILKEALRRPELNNAEYHLTLNYDDVIKYPYKYLNDETISLVEKVMKTFDQIDSFNFTIILKRGIIDFDKFEDDWYHIDIVFYGGRGDDDDEDVVTLNNFNKYARFDFSCNSSKRGLKTDEELFNYENGKLENIFEFDNVGETIDLMLQLNELLDKQYQERKVLIDKLRKTE